MATREQLEAEPWWDREVVTAELAWLGDELCRLTGQPATAAGDKGNTSHLRGAHRSQEWLLKSVYCTNDTYTVQSGLTAEQLLHVAGFDFTPGVWGAAENRRRMREQTRRLFDALAAGLLSGVLEVIGTLDGVTVTGRTSSGAVISSDSSHLDHWHLTIDRRRMRDRALMGRIVGTVMGDALMALSDTDARALIWRVEGLTHGRTAVAGGPTKGEPIEANVKAGEQDAAIAALQADVDELKSRPPVVVGLTAEEIRAIVREELAASRAVEASAEAAADRARADVLDGPVSAA